MVVGLGNIYLNLDCFIVEIFLSRIEGPLAFQVYTFKFWSHCFCLDNNNHFCSRLVVRSPLHPGERLCHIQPILTSHPWKDVCVSIPQNTGNLLQFLSLTIHSHRTISSKSNTTPQWTFSQSSEPSPKPVCPTVTQLWTPPSALTVFLTQFQESPELSNAPWLLQCWKCSPFL